MITGARRATISDVASAAGVSTATVSRVLNGQRVTESTAARVRVAATDLRYTPNALTRGVFAGRSSTIGVVIRDLDSPFYLELMRGIEEVAAANDSLVTFANTYRRGDREAAQVRAMDGQRVRGLVVTTGRTTDEQTRWMAAGGTPCVIVARTVEHQPPNLHTISLDNDEAGRLVADHLLACARSSIGVICAGVQPSQSERVAGLRRALARHGVALPDDAVAIAEASTDVPAAVTRLLAGRSLDTVVCLTGRLSVNVYEALLGSGRTVPDDVAFLTVDEFPWAAALGITLIAQPAHEMGRQAAELVVGGVGEASRLVVAPRLVARRSCGEGQTR